MVTLRVSSHEAEDESEIEAMTVGIWILMIVGVNELVRDRRSLSSRRSVSDRWINKRYWQKEFDDDGVALFDGEFEIEGVEDKKTLELQEIERAGVCGEVFEDAED